MLYKDIRWFSPVVRKNYIYARNPHSGCNLRYNHCVDVVCFQGRYIAMWNANSTPAEGVAGQYNYIAYSDDYITWSVPEQVFTGSHCINPIAADYQWQPSLINVRDEYLLCAWCTIGGASNHLYISRSNDGILWSNKEIPNAPMALHGQVNAFPTNHGFISRTGRLIFPCSLPQMRPNGIGYSCSETKYSALIMSDDGGETWFWSDPIRCADFSAYGGETEVPGERFASVWEPMVYDAGEGKLGLLVRNSQAQDRCALSECAHQMLFASFSHDDGQTWTQSFPVEVETICSRNFTLGVRETSGMIMLQNDQQVRVPAPISLDRYHLAAFFSPMPDPDLLLPGPVLFPIGRAYYPNGFIQNGALYFAASAPGGIVCGTLEPLPDYATPFFMVREGRFPPEKSENGWLNLTCKETTIPLVLSTALTNAPCITMHFDFHIEACCEEDFPLLTVGGIDREGFILALACNQERDVLVVRTPHGEEHVLLAALGTEVHHIRVELGHEHSIVQVDALAEFSLPGKVLRKIAFGGLYTPQLWPDIAHNYSQIWIHANTVTLEG